MATPPPPRFDTSAGPLTPLVVVALDPSFALAVFGPSLTLTA